MVGQRNEAAYVRLQAEYDALGELLQRRGIDIASMKEAAMRFAVAVPSFGVATGGSMARWPAGLAGEPRDLLDRLDDLGVVNQLTGITPGVSLSVSRDRYDHPAELRDYAHARGLGFDVALADGPGGLADVEESVRRLAIDRVLAATGFPRDLGAGGVVVRLSAGIDYPGHVTLQRAHGRLMDSLRTVYSGLPPNWRMFVAPTSGESADRVEVLPEGKATLDAIEELGERAFALLDLGRDREADEAAAVTRLCGAGRLGRMHFGDGSLGRRSHGLFLALVALEEARAATDGARAPACMVDQARDGVDPIEALMVSAMAAERAAIQAALVDREVIANLEDANDGLMVSETLKLAFHTDVEPILAMARHQKGAAIEPIPTYRASGYRQKIMDHRPAKTAPRPA